jgi:hypothetical protein
MASFSKGAVVRDEKVVIYADPPSVSFWSFWGLITLSFLLLPLFGIWLILWLVLHTLKTRKPAHNAPTQGNRRAARGSLI